MKVVSLDPGRSISFLTMMSLVWFNKHKESQAPMNQAYSESESLLITIVTINIGRWTKDLPLGLPSDQSSLFTSLFRQLTLILVDVSHVILQCYI